MFELLHLQTLINIRIMKKSFDVRSWAVLIFAGIIFTGQVEAQQIAYINTNSLPATGLQNTGSQTGDPFVLGLEFTVNSAVVISQLGAYDATIGGSGLGFGSTVYVGIYSEASSSFISQTGIFSGTVGSVVSGYRFQNISALTLNPGTYMVVAAGYGISNAPNWNSAVWIQNAALPTTTPSLIQFNNGGGLLTMGSSFFDNNAGGQLQPATQNVSSGYVGPLFGAGTFVFAPVPEPTTTELILASVLLIGGLRIRRHFLGRRTNREPEV
jgi:hypothetical protein